MSDSETYYVRIDPRFIEVARREQVAVDVDLHGRRRNSPGISVSTPTKGCLSPVLDYTQKARVGTHLARLFDRLLSHLTLLISSKPTDNTPMVRMSFVALCVA